VSQAVPPGTVRNSNVLSCPQAATNLAKKVEHANGQPQPRGFSESVIAHPAPSLADRASSACRAHVPGRKAEYQEHKAAGAQSGERR
jgi:hypothetical protein